MKTLKKFIVIYRQNGKFEFYETNSKYDAQKFYAVLKSHRITTYIEGNGKK